MSQRNSAGEGKVGWGREKNRRNGLLYTTQTNGEKSIGSPLLFALRNRALPRKFP